MPSRPRSQKLCTLALRSAKTSGDVSLSESNTLITPRFSATKTRPSLLNRTTVGLTKPLTTVDSWNPAGRVAASADREVPTTDTLAIITSTMVRMEPGIRRCRGDRPGRATPPRVDAIIHDITSLLRLSATMPPDRDSSDRPRPGMRPGRFSVIGRLPRGATGSNSPMGPCAHNPFGGPTGACSATLIPLIHGASRVNRSNCQASAETTSGINRRRNVSIRRSRTYSTVPPAGLEPADCRFPRSPLIWRNRALTSTSARGGTRSGASASPRL